MCQQFPVSVLGARMFPMKWGGLTGFLVWTQYLKAKCNGIAVILGSFWEGEKIW